MIKKWKMDKPENWDKSFFIRGPVINLEVDYDDVDHSEVVKEARRVTVLLNATDLSE